MTGLRALAVVGPTCTGKTSLAIDLASRLAPAELVNADSRQVLRGLAVGTCAPTAAELGDVRCHLVGVVEPGEDYTVAQWAAAAREIVTGLRADSRLPIVVGGTGLYVSALTEGFDFGAAPPDRAMRAEREAQAAAGGLEALVAELAARDPSAAATVDVRNPRRVVRALEILDSRPGPLSMARGRTAAVPTLIIGLEPPRETHDSWIGARTTRLFATGALVEETEAALARGIPADVLANSGIGYREALTVLDGRMDLDEAIDATARRTRRYASTQRAYWRREPRVRWLDPTLLDADALTAELRPALDHHPQAGLREP